MIYDEKGQCKSKKRIINENSPFTYQFTDTTIVADNVNRILEKANSPHNHLNSVLFTALETLARE